MSQPYCRVFNFSAGPSSMPVEVLEEAQEGMLNWKGCGMGVMEMSHRGKIFEGILDETIADFRKLANVPDNYKVLFIQGGASMQNTMIPMNFVRPGETSDYIVTGAWGEKSEEAARVVGNVHLAYAGKADNYTKAPDLNSLTYSPNPCYVHFTSNETIHGVEYKTDPVLNNGAPLVCDMSSNILSRPFDISKYALIYAGAQKNQGPSGVALVLIREDMLGRTPKPFHMMLDYNQYAKNNSMPNTPPTWAIYICGLMYKWVARNGGLEPMHARNKEKAAILYEAIDNSGGFYTGHADKDCRSLMNVTFRLPTDELTDKFCKEGAQEKLDGMKGHRSVGGIRASIYNAFPKEGCEALASFMKEFARRNG